MQKNQNTKNFLRNGSVKKSLQAQKAEGVSAILDFPPVGKRGLHLPIDLIDRVDAAIVASIQAELIEAITGRTLSKQTPQSLTLMLSSLTSGKA